jgi:hypothetical protein
MPAVPFCLSAPLPFTPGKNIVTRRCRAMLGGGTLNPSVYCQHPSLIHLYVEDVDAFFNRALAAGAKSASQSWISFMETALASSRTLRSYLVGGYPQRGRRPGRDAEARGGNV